ncbi:hypothetical protein GCM10011504_11570 [Siccirubricoccus deserti]|nr:hypothetical protein GCM10011504_11570 [Siccirubricoccus deserti]
MPGMLARNPHIRFVNNRRGHCWLETMFRTAPYVTDPDAPCEDRGRFLAEAGSARRVPA